MIAKIIIIRSGKKNMIAINQMRPLLGLINRGSSVGIVGSRDEIFSGKSEGNFSIILSNNLPKLIGPAATRWQWVIFLVF